MENICGKGGTVMKLITIIKRIKERCKGSLTCAKENGMIVESGVTVMGGGKFWFRTLFNPFKRKLSYFI